MNRLKTLARTVGLAAALALAGAAPAQDAGSGKPDLDRARDLADRLMEAMGYQMMTASMPEVLADSAGRSLTSCTPATPPQDVRRLETLLRAELVQAMPRYYERIRDSYVHRLSVEDLQALADFYESPAGERIADAAADLIYDQFIAQVEIDRASLRAYEQMGWCDNEL